LVFTRDQQPSVHVARSDVQDPLASWSEHGFELDGAHWPSVEHYFQAMQFEDPGLRDTIRAAAHPREAEKIGKKNRRRARRDWKIVRTTLMTRGVYVKCRTHPEAAQALLATGDRPILETSQYDYFWGCGRDLRGENAYGKVLMAVRAKLREEGVGP
jgi:ribA/ribD-fused uncharacterized protein